MEQQYENIEAYLEGTLPEPERQAFEAELSRDADLAAEVELHRRLQSTLGDEAEWQFRQNLDAISNAYEAPAEQPGTGKQSALRLLGGTLLLIVIASLLYYFFMPSLKSPLPERPTIEQPAPSPTAPENTTPPVEETEAAAPETEPSDTPPVAEHDPNQPNPALETLAEASPLSTAYELLLDAQLQGNTFSLEGEMLSAQYNANQPMAIAFFDNRPSSYPGSPLHTGELQVVKIEEDAPIAFAAKQAYFVTYETDLDLMPGLYYYVIRVEGEPEALWAGKVER